ncbi:MAG: ParB-like nuclease domain-containing protein [Thermoplasmatales archaeon]|nr:ParB-like nuclease domain-containing protein [Thermoplasmatales archaeon]
MTKQKNDIKIEAGDKPKKINIDDIVINPELMPREELDKTLVETYAENVDALPPIILNQEDVLIDGWHRLEAHKLKGLKEIEYILKKTKDDKEIMEEAVKANATHGKQLSMKEKKKTAIRLFDASDGNPDYKKHLLSIFGVSKSTLYKWIEDIAKEKEELFKDDIINTYLQAELTEEQVAEKYNVAQSTVSKIVNDLAKSLNSEKSINEEIFDSNIWEINTANSFDESDMCYNETALNTNILYRYTKPFDIVYIPTETTMLDSCKKWLRRYFTGDEMVAKPHLAALDYNKDFKKDISRIRTRMKEGHIIIKCNNLQEDTTVFTMMEKQGMSLLNRIIIPKLKSSFEDGYESLLVYKVK